MYRKVYTLLVFAAAVTMQANAQDFKGKLKSQEKTIKAALKSKKITDREYEKLMMEQQTIKNTLEKYELDGVLTSKEKNAIHDKLVRSDKRLARYKTNGEVY
ncbi:hypothetical protein [Polluticoccus soli]|uniref:hypothetical protein n=1 Tax=Polluticoccus soli TaxID=3034150 RepID=UPI0023E13258|nr:hypothetical protein [Flavipsychrobacter sp. JY13-12]